MNVRYEHAQKILKCIQRALNVLVHHHKGDMQNANCCAGGSGG